MRFTSTRLAQKLYWRQLLGTSNNSINIIKAVGRAGIQRAMDLFGDDGVKRRMQMGNVQQYVKDSARMADRQTDRLVLQDHITFRDIDSHLRAHGTHMSPASVASLMHECGRHGISLGHDHLRVLNSRLKRSPETLSATQISKLFHAMSHLQSDVTEVRLFIATAQQLLASLPIEQFTVPVFVGLLHNLRPFSTEYPEIVHFVHFLTNRLRQRLSPSSGPALVFRASDISTMMFGAHNLDSRHKEVKGLLAIYTELLKGCPDDFTSSEAARCLYGLARCRASGAVGAGSSQLDSKTGGGVLEVRALLAALQDPIKHSPLKWSDRDLGAAVFGLQSLDCSLPEMRSILFLLLPRLVRCPDLFGSQTIAVFLFGLKNCSADSEAVIEVMRAVRMKLKQAGVELRGLEAGIAMLGLQHMSEDNPVVAKNIKSLAELLEKDPIVSSTVRRRVQDTSSLGAMSSTTVLGGIAPGDISATRSGSLAPSDLTGHIIANCLYGLKGKSADSSAVRKWLKRVGDRVHSAGTFLPEDVAMSMFGMNGMSSRWGRVASIVLELSRKLEESTLTGDDITSRTMLANSRRGVGSRGGMEQTVSVGRTSRMIADGSGGAHVWRPRSITCTLYGLRSMSSRHPEVLAFVRAFEACVANSAGSMNAQEICTSLYGLQGLSSRHGEVQLLLETLCSLIERSIEEQRDSFLQNTQQNLHGAAASVDSEVCSGKSSGGDVTTSGGENANISEPPQLQVQQRKPFFLQGMTSQGVGNALYGLRNMHSNHGGVKRALFIIRTYLFADKLRLSPVEITMALTGLRHLPVSCRHSTHIIAKLARQLKLLANSEEAVARASRQMEADYGSNHGVSVPVSGVERKKRTRAQSRSNTGTGSFSADLISQSFLALSHKEASPTVRTLLGALLGHLRGVGGLEGATIGKILKGLRLMKSEVPQVSTVCSAV
jgi:hypothetical protein